jgi:hypothetical protein
MNNTIKLKFLTLRKRYWNKKYIEFSSRVSYNIFLKINLVNFIEKHNKVVTLGTKI